MNKPRVSYEQAVRLKAVGYDVPTQMCYLKNGETGRSERLNNHNAYGNAYSMPTLDDVCRWLRETHGLHIGLIYSIYTTMWRTIICDMKFTNEISDIPLQPTHDAAQSAAIDACLTIIEERKKTTK